MKRLWMAGLAGLLMAAPVLGEQRFDERYDVSADVSVKIDDVIGGSLEIIGWGKNVVEIKGTLGDDVVKLEVEVRANRIHIRPILPEKDNSDVDVDLIIKVPEKASRVSVGTVSASIDVRGIKRRLSVASVSGPIEVDGDMEAADLATVSGEINSRGKRDDLDVASVSGDVVIVGDTGDVSIANVSGGVQYNGRPRDLEISSVSGNVRLVVPGDVQAEFALSTFNGNISDAFGHQPKKKSFVGGHELEFSTGSKGDIEISSVSGNVKIEKN